jgi:hypothetical protein
MYKVKLNHNEKYLIKYYNEKYYNEKNFKLQTVPEVKILYRLTYTPKYVHISTFKACINK